MLRSEINHAYGIAAAFFEKNRWALRPDFHWDITDFGLGQFQQFGLVLINLANEPEYCEKLMYAHKNQQTPAHYHLQKKEDIICRTGQLAIQLWPKGTEPGTEGVVTVKINGEEKMLECGEIILLNAGERITLHPGIWHAFWPQSEQCIIGEVSTANDDAHDNYFHRKDIGRFPDIVEDEPALIKLVSEK